MSCAITIMCSFSLSFSRLNIRRNCPNTNIQQHPWNTVCHHCTLCIIIVTIITVVIILVSLVLCETAVSPMYNTVICCLPCDGTCDTCDVTDVFRYCAPKHCSVQRMFAVYVLVSVCVQSFSSVNKTEYCKFCELLSTSISW